MGYQILKTGNLQGESKEAAIDMTRTGNWSTYFSYFYFYGPGLPGVR